MSLSSFEAQGPVMNGLKRVRFCYQPCSNFAHSFKTKRLHLYTGCNQSPKSGCSSQIHHERQHSASLLPELLILCR